MDFTLSNYKELILSFREGQYIMIPYKCYFADSSGKSVILRHDVDARPENSLAFAKIQSSLGINGSYYFRFKKEGFEESIIKEISAMGHEIGYHYETMDTQNGNIDKGYDEFCRNLEQLRKIAPVTTICMHGSPLSKFDNRAIWEKFDYRQLGIIGEPYFDTDFSKVFYLTDTGRRWDGSKVSVRDKVGGRRSEVSGLRSEPGTRNQELRNQELHSTGDIIRAIESGRFPDQVMMTFHPQRWTDKPLPWLQELVFQNAKNVVKRYLLR